MMIVPAVVQHAYMDLFKIFSLKPTVDQTTIYPTWDKRANHYIADTHKTLRVEWRKHRFA